MLEPLKGSISSYLTYRRMSPVLRALSSWNPRTPGVARGSIEIPVICSSSAARVIQGIPPEAPTHLADHASDYRGDDRIEQVKARRAAGDAVMKPLRAGVPGVTGRRSSRNRWNPHRYRVTGHRQASPHQRDGQSSSVVPGRSYRSSGIARMTVLYECDCDFARSSLIKPSGEQASQCYHRVPLKAKCL